MQTLFFDLDGTLTDSKPGIVACIRHALGRIGRPVPPEEELLWCIGPPLAESFLQMTGSREVAAEALAHYRERYVATGIFENAVYPGIPELLSELSGAGHRLFLATSKRRDDAERILQHFGLDGFFERAFGAAPDGRLARKSELLAHALAETGVDPAAAVMIGDRRHDIEGARANGLVSIGVLYGYGGETELREAGAGRLAADAAELAALLRSAGAAA